MSNSQIASVSIEAILNWQKFDRDLAALNKRAERNAINVAVKFKADTAQLRNEIRSLSNQSVELKLRVNPASAANQVQSFIRSNSNNALNIPVNAQTKPAQQAIGQFSNNLPKLNQVLNVATSTASSQVGTFTKSAAIQMTGMGAAAGGAIGVAISAAIVGVGVGINEIQKVFTEANTQLDTLRSGIRDLTLDAGKAVFDIGARFEANVITFDTLFKRFDRKGEDFIREVQDFAIRTPFSQENAINSSRFLAGAGLTPEKTLGVSRQIADIASASGDRGSENFESLSRTYAKIQARGKADARSLQEFATRGVDMIGAIAEVSGKTRQEIIQLTREGKVGIDAIDAGLKNLTGEGGAFAGLSDRLSQSLGGILSNIQDAGIATAQNIYSAYSPAILKIAEGFQNAVSGIGRDPAILGMLAESADRIKSTFELNPQFLETLKSGMTELATGGLRIVTDLAEKFTGYLAQNPEVINRIVQLLTLMGQNMARDLERDLQRKEAILSWGIAVESFQQKMQPAYDALNQFQIGVLETGTRFINWIQSGDESARAFDRVSATVLGILSPASAAITLFSQMSRIGDEINRAAKLISSTISGDWSAGLRVAQGINNAILGSFRGIGSAINGIVKTMSEKLNPVTQGFSNIWNQVSSTTQFILNRVLDGFLKRIGAIGNKLRELLGLGGSQDNADSGGNAGTGETIAFKGVQVTSAVDASGEPGLDYVVSDGKRGAKFGSLTDGRVIKVVSNQNWETNLESNPGGRRGYGNQVIVRTIDKITGQAVDVLYAHLDKVLVQEGESIGIGTVLGTQGRTGSTTGAHVSVDFFGKDSNSTTPAAIAMRDRLARILANNPSLLNGQIQRQAQSQPTQQRSQSSPNLVGTVAGFDPNRINRSVQLLMQQGLSPLGAAMLTGSFMQESGLNPKADNGTHIGLMQWDKRHRARNMPRNDFDGQVKYAVIEGMQDRPDSIRTLKNPNATRQEVEQAIRNMTRYGPGEEKSRFQYGAEIYRQMGSSSVRSPAQTVAPRTSMTVYDGNGKPMTLNATRTNSDFAPTGEAVDGDDIFQDGDPNKAQNALNSRFGKEYQALQERIRSDNRAIDRDAQIVQELRQERWTQEDRRIQQERALSDERLNRSRVLIDSEDTTAQSLHELRTQRVQILRRDEDDQRQLSRQVETYQSARELKVRRNRLRGKSESEIKALLNDPEFASVEERDRLMTEFRSGKLLDGLDSSPVDFTRAIGTVQQAQKMRTQIRDEALGTLQLQGNKLITDSLKRSQLEVGALPLRVAEYRDQLGITSPLEKHRTELAKLTAGQEEFGRSTNTTIERLQALSEAPFTTPEQKTQLQNLIATAQQSGETFKTATESAKRYKEALFFNDQLQSSIGRDRAFLEVRNRALSARTADLQIYSGAFGRYDRAEIEANIARSDVRVDYQQQLAQIQRYRIEAEQNPNSGFSTSVLNEMERLSGEELQSKLRSISLNVKNFSNEIRDDLTSGFTQGFTDVLMGAKSFGDAIGDIFKNLAQKFISVGLNSLFSSLFGSIFNGAPMFADGGLIERYADGGIIPGVRSRKDDQLILAQKGEAVLTHKGVDLLGETAINTLNRGILPKFANGGMIGSGMMPNLQSRMMPMRSSQFPRSFNVNIQTKSIAGEEYVTVSQLRDVVSVVTRRTESYADNAVSGHVESIQSSPGYRSSLGMS
ncbi:phage tail tip lysozyme [Leptolyngbya sp. NIES-2104]|uniref:phage tail tip lysozyme n=1 Tax=Leptolyngbya sp. NIES-2104 TaxID=1552121 RepID=UPI0006EC8CD7|nr:phage tail tip lysozyme [Leptolyngbya sp. NIES-2104]GAP96087.1 Mu-like prophage protein [Leptolyngbya sp. NIES-2104]